MRKPPRALAVLVLLVAVGAATAPPAAVAAGHAKHHRRAKVARPPLRPQLDGGALYGDGAAGAATPGTIPSASTAPGVTGGAVVAATASTGPTGTVGPTAPTSAGGVAAPGPPVDPRPTTGATGATGPTGPTAPPTAPGSLAQILPDGLAQAPANAPLAVQQAIAAGNELIGKPYLWGGGHRSWIASGYDCSGAVSFALHGAGLLDAPLISGAFATWGLPGAGAWITIYANPTHAFVDIAGIRLDTSRTDDPGGLDGPRWRPLRISDRGYAVRHPAAY